MTPDTYAGVATRKLRIPTRETAGRRRQALQHASTLRAVRAAMRDALGGELPPRYVTDTWRAPFDARLQSALAPSLRILDVGAGRIPTIPVDQRPAGAAYTGMDISGEELSAAAPGSYDAIVVTDLAREAPELRGSFDLAVSWFALEHVEPLDEALANLHSYLRPGGRLVAHLSGTFALFSLLNRLLPGGLASALMHRLLGRQPESVFPAAYDRCWHSGLERLLARHFERVRVTPIYTGALYFTFSRSLCAAYVGYEEWAYRTRRHNLASYYLIDAIA